MDILTQGILGAAIAEAGWRKDLGRGAIFAGILFGLVPDFDVISGLWGEWTSMVHHRGFTHSIFFAPLMAAPAGYLFWRINKRRGEATAWMHMLFWVLLTHPLLDVFTSYGTQLLTPVSDTRFALDGVSIIDPLYTFPLIGALIVARLWQDKPDRGRRAAQVMLTLTTLYLGLGYLVAESTKEQAREQLVQREYPKIERMRAMPTFANLLLWRIVAKDERGDIHVGLVSRAQPTPVPFQTVKKLESPLIDKTLKDERAQIFTWFADEYIHYRIEEKPPHTLVYLDDMRYGGIQKPAQAMWSARATYDEENKLLDVSRTQRRPRDVGAEFGELWRMIWEGTEQKK
jgi:inner membrane protein